MIAGATIHILVMMNDQVVSSLAQSGEEMGPSD